MVASSDSVGRLASRSAFGRTGVDLAAPGVNIVTTGSGTSYPTFSGTSAAAPMVAGAAALLLASQPDLTVDQLKGALFSSVDQPAALRGKLVTSVRLNLARAVSSLTNTGGARHSHNRVSREPSHLIRFTDSSHFQSSDGSILRGVCFLGDAVGVRSL